MQNILAQNEQESIKSKKNIALGGHEIAFSDSIKIRKLIDENDLNRYGGKYDIAFDNLWEALILAEKYNRNDALVEIYRDIGILYDIYNKDSLAINYLQRALLLSKKIALTDKDISVQKISNYFSIATFWRDRHKYELSLVYLDSCYTVYGDSLVLPYVLTDQGFCNMKLGNITIAEKQLKHALLHLIKENAPYVAVNQAFIADLKTEIYQYDSALHYYHQSLEWIETQQVHTELKASILQKASEIYVIKGNLKKAITYLKEAKFTNDKLFSTTSKQNQRLFEIKNKYKAKLEQNKLTIEKQKLLIQQKDKKFTNTLILFVTITVLGIVVYTLFHQQSKFRRLSILNKLESKKNEAILEVKNKELTTYAIKVVKMEENLDYLVKLIKAKAPKEYNEYKRKHAHKSNDTWDEFNQRFMEVNNKFYKTLCSKHPDLTPTELKHCALIKLNFNNYEMSKILNISLRSVHTSRYRIRKKIGLDSNGSLTSYIGSL